MKDITSVLHSPEARVVMVCEEMIKLIFGKDTTFCRGSMKIAGQGQKGDDCITHKVTVTFSLYEEKEKTCGSTPCRAHFSMIRHKKQNVWLLAEQPASLHHTGQAFHFLAQNGQPLRVIES